jgi:hypothetical protein
VINKGINMNNEEKQAEAYWAYQNKQANLQRMVDKGWGDREAYNKLLVEEAKRARIRKYKKIASDVLIGTMFVGFVLALLFLTGCSSTSSVPGTTGTAYNQAPSQQLLLDKQVAALTRNEVINGVTECEGAGLRAHVITTKRSINGFTADIPVEVTCMPRFKY